MSYEGENIRLGQEGLPLQWGTVDYKPRSHREEDLSEILGEMYDLSAKVFNGYQGISANFNGIVITIDARDSHNRDKLIAEVMAQYRANKQRLSEN